MNSPIPAFSPTAPTRPRTFQAWVAGLLLCLCLGPAAAGGHADPVNLVRETTDSLLRAAAAERDAIARDPAHAHALIERIASPHVDYEAIARGVLGKNWRRASADQRHRFVRQFRHLLVRTYATAITEYAGAEISYLPARMRAGGREAVVRTSVPRGGAGLSVSYRLRRDGDAWRIRDVSIEGVSMVATYRSNFASQMRSGGLEGLIERLEARNGEVSSGA